MLHARYTLGVRSEGLLRLLGVPRRLRALQLVTPQLQPRRDLQLSRTSQYQLKH